MTSPQLPLWTEWVRWGVEVLTPLAAIALFIATLSLVNKTRAVAERTAELVKETIRGTDQLDRHHQEGLLPVVYVEAGLVISKQTRQNVRGMKVELVGELVNVGVGPSISVNLLVRPAGIVERWFYVGLIGANSRRTLREVEWFLPHYEQQEGNWPFEVTTKYETLFDTTGHTFQRSHSGLPKDLVTTDSQKPTIRPRRIRDETATALESVPPVNDAASTG